MPYFFNRLSYKIIFPVTATMLLTGIPLYFLLHSTIIDFARQNIQKDLEFLSRHIFDITDRAFMELVKDGKASDPIAVRIKQVDCMDAIERFNRDQNFYTLITTDDGNILFHNSPDASLDLVSIAHDTKDIGKHFDRDNAYFTRRTAFSPWHWEITVFKDAEKYADLWKKITSFSLMIGTIWMVTTALLILFLLRTIQSPIRAIMNSISKGEYPSYRGTVEFEFLGNAIAEMMRSLQEERQRLEDNEQRLQIINEEIQALLDNSPVGIVYVGTDRVIKEVNQEICTMSGYSREELVGTSTRTLFATNRDFERFGAKVYPQLAAKGSASCDWQLKHRDGRLIWSHLHGRLITTREGSQAGIWIIEEITERLKTEQELLKIKKLEAVGVLAGGLAHDFNNLLTAILGNLGMAASRLSRDNPARPFIDLSERAAVRAADLTRKLLTFSKGDAPVRQSASLPELIRESADFVLHGSGVRCRYDLPADLHRADIDRGQISQVIQNLVLNARQSMNDKGTLTISGRNIRRSELPANARGLQENEYVRIAIEDTGPGIPEKIADRIFDPYFSTKDADATKGSGLGLAIVHSIMGKHNGLVTAESPTGRGAIFSLYLPASRGGGEEKQRQPAGKPQPQAGKAPGLVLIMDDEEMIRETAGAMLGHLGYRTIEASDGEEALALYRKHMKRGSRIDLVIMDLTIPGGMGGKDAVRELLTLDPDALVVVSSGYAEDPIMADHKEYGFTAALAKPFSLQALEELLAELFAGNTGEKTEQEPS